MCGPAQTSDLDGPSDCPESERVGVVFVTATLETAPGAISGTVSHTPADTLRLKCPKLTGNIVLKLDVRSVLTGLNDKDRGVVPLGETGGDNETGETTTNDNKVEFLVLDVGYIGSSRAFENASCRISEGGRSDC